VPCLSINQEKVARIQAGQSRQGAAGQVSESRCYRYSSIDSDPVTFILRVRTERICAESHANIPRHDQEIVDLRDAIQGNSAHCEVYAIKQTKPSAQAGPLKAGSVPMAHKELDQGKGPGLVIHFSGRFLLMR